MNNKIKKPRFIALRPGSIIYGIVLVVSLIFTQALRSPASAILFVFLLLLPIISLIYIVVARAGIKVYTECDKTRAAKDESVSYEIKIINETPLPFPFVETVVSLPSENAVICRDDLMRITLLPMGAHIVNSEVSFPLRGSYDIGVKYMYVGDLFGLFRTEVKLELHRTVIVYPRNIIMSADSNRNETDLPTSVTKRSVSPEQAEQSDIRVYIPGDSMKNIHWKLSSKSEELQVKNFSSNTDKHTYILCDLSFAGDLDHNKADSNKPANKAKKQKKSKRRGKAENSAGIDHARAVGSAGNGENTSGATTADKLAALGVTNEALAALETVSPKNDIDVITGSTSKGSKKAARKEAERMARLAAIVVESEMKESENTGHSVYVKENLPFAGELCADSTIELALSLMRYETARGASCTVLYPDSRSANGLGALSSANDIPEDPALIQFFTAPVCRNKNSFTELAMMIGQSTGLTIRIVSANTDIHSAALFSAIPAAFGGAGTGCTAEVLLASPKGLWTSPADRAVAAQSMSEELARNSIGTRQFSIENGNDGNLRFSSGI